jgi:glycosyltransferase involved in cell wall biosynthesis
VTVVIPTYNRVSDLERALRSVLAQTYADWEVVVVDNHSTDATEAMVRSWGDPRIRFCLVHNHGVVAVSRNRGITEARGELIAFLDSDDWWSPEKLERAVAACDAGADVVYHDLVKVTRHGQEGTSPRLPTFDLRVPVRADLIARGNPLANSSVVVRRSLLQAIGGLSEEPSLAAWEDFDCWLRLAARTDRFVRIPAALGFYWAGGGNMSSAARTIHNLEEFCRRYLADRPGRLPAWIEYGLGRALYLVHRDAEAAPRLMNVLRSDTSVLRRAKASFMLIAMPVRRVSRADTR